MLEASSDLRAVQELLRHSNLPPHTNLYSLKFPTSSRSVRSGAPKSEKRGKSAVKTKEILTALLINIRLLRRNIGKYSCQ